MFNSNFETKKNPIFYLTCTYLHTQEHCSESVQFPGINPLASDFSSQYHPQIQFEGHKNNVNGNDH